MKLAIVVQRYGQAINGGAELHARYIAERLARHADVEVLTTCATDYVTWRNGLPAGTDQINGVAVRRFPVKHEREPELFGRRSERVFREPHSVADELAWLDAEGPASHALIRHLAHHAASYDFCIFFSYRYYHAYHGVRAAASRAILVPTAERDAAIGLSIFHPVFRGVRGIMYNSPEERAMIHAAAQNQSVPGVVVGVGSEVPSSPQPGRFRQKFNVREPFAVYVGRIDENKGCPELFEFFRGYLADPYGRLSLVLVGNSLLPVPEHPRIRHLGFLDDSDKFDAIAAADLLVMPSYFESLSMVALEAWALGRPVLANANCDVLHGQCLRSNAGLFYSGYSEFIESLRAVEQNRWLAAALGRNGREYYRQNYDWPVIERKYLDMLTRLGGAPAASDMAPMPDWFARHRRDLPAGEDVLSGLPRGPVLEDRAGSRPEASDEPPEPIATPDHRPTREPQRPREPRGRSDFRRGPRGGVRRQGNP